MGAGVKGKRRCILSGGERPALAGVLATSPPLLRWKGGRVAATPGGCGSLDRYRTHWSDREEDGGQSGSCCSKSRKRGTLAQRIMRTQALSRVEACGSWFQNREEKELALRTEQLHGQHKVKGSWSYRAPCVLPRIWYIKNRASMTDKHRLLTQHFLLSFAIHLFQRP